MSDSTNSSLIQNIKNALPEFSTAFRQLANFILENTFAASSMGIEEISQKAEVSVATVNRFARQCGYAGYPQFRADLRSLFDKIFEPVEKIRSDNLRQADEQEIIQLSLEATARNIQEAQNTLPQNAITEALELILSARFIFVAGMGVSALHASFMVDCLEPYLPNKIREINGFCGAERAFRRTNMLTEQDLLIAITLPRYSKSTIELVDLAKKHGCKVLALTDEHTSPIVPLAETSLFIPSQHPVLYAANAAMMALIEAISSAVILKIKHSAFYAEQQTQIVLPYLYLPGDQNTKLK